MKRLTARELTELARETPWRDLDRPAVERVRAKLREEALAGPAPAVRAFSDRKKMIAWCGAALAAGAAFATLFFSGFEAGFGTREDAAPIAAVEPEIVRLTDGHIQVRAREHGDRPLRVVIGDAEIEARAADFEVIAENDRVVRVVSSSGMVEVKRLGVMPMVLQPGVRWEAKKRAFTEQRLAPRGAAARASRGGSHKNATKVASPVEVDVPRELGREPLRESWREPRSADLNTLPIELPKIETPEPPVVEETPPIAAAPENAPANAPVDAPVKKADVKITSLPAAPLQTAEPGSDETKFHKGWELYQAKRYAEAARAFEGVHRAGPWGEDAAYWRAQAIVRLTRTAESIAALRAFLSQYPASARRGEIAVTLGWLLIKADQPKEARRMFEIAAEDPSEVVRESARRGYLEAEDD